MAILLKKNIRWYAIGLQGAGAVKNRNADPRRTGMCGVAEYDAGEGLDQQALQAQVDRVGRRLRNRHACRRVRERSSRKAKGASPRAALATSGARPAASRAGSSTRW